MTHKKRNNSFSHGGKLHDRADTSVTSWHVSMSGPDAPPWLGSHGKTSPSWSGITTRMNGRKERVEQRDYKAFPVEDFM